MACAICGTLLRICVVVDQLVQAVARMSHGHVDVHPLAGWLLIRGIHSLSPLRYDVAITPCRTYTVASYQASSSPWHPLQ